MPAFSLIDFLSKTRYTSVFQYQTITTPVMQEGTRISDREGWTQQFLHAGVKMMAAKTSYESCASRLAGPASLETEPVVGLVFPAREQI